MCHHMPIQQTLYTFSNNWLLEYSNVFSKYFQKRKNHRAPSSVYIPIYWIYGYTDGALFIHQMWTQAMWSTELDMHVPFAQQTNGSSRLNITNKLNLITYVSSKRQIFPRFQNQRKPKSQQPNGVLVSVLGRWDYTKMNKGHWSSIQNPGQNEAQTTLKNTS